MTWKGESSRELSRKRDLLKRGPKSSFSLRKNFLCKERGTMENEW